MDGTDNIYGVVISAKTKDPLTTLGSPAFDVNGGGDSTGGVYYRPGSLSQETQPTT